MKPYYEDGSVTIYHGRCEDLLLPGLAVDLLLSDPPYGMDWDTDSRRFTGGKGHHVKSSDRVAGDREPFDPAPFLAYPKVTLWGANHYAARLPVGSSLVWVKKAPDKFGKFLSDGEIGWENEGHGVYVWSHIWDGCARESENGRHYHPTQKPVALMAWCINRRAVPAGGLVLDPFMGSGTTLVAAKNLGLRAIGIELDERHCETAANRLSQNVLDLGAA